MTLREAQSVFARLVPRLIDQAYALGYEVTLGEAWRHPKTAEYLGFANSNHVRRLAIDINLFKNGQYLTDTESHKELGEYWETLHPLARWGGRFKDGNHYSFEWNGVM